VTHAQSRRLEIIWVAEPRKEPTVKTLGTGVTAALLLLLLLGVGPWAQQQGVEELTPPSRPAAPESAPPPAPQEQGQSAPPSEPPLPLATSKPVQQGALLSTRTLIGTMVKNTRGEELGTLQECLVDPQSGRIVSAVLAFGGVLGMQEKTVAIPWEALKIEIREKELVVEVDQAQLQTAPRAEVPTPSATEGR
jgi:sporulation protein YlmC with PRC-barrel domain